MQLKSKIEALLFVAGKPMTAKKISEIIKSDESEIKQALKELQTDYEKHGIQVFSTGSKWQMGTSGDAVNVVERFVKEEFAGELTRPQSEALTVIAYRGPISKLELEVIRGVSCSLILRNLMIRGLIDEEYDATLKQTKYRISIDFLRHLGVSSVDKLPNYEALHGHEVIDTLLEESEKF